MRYTMKDCQRDFRDRKYQFTEMQVNGKRVSACIAGDTEEGWVDELDLEAYYARGDKRAPDNIPTKRHYGSVTIQHVPF